MREIDFYYLWVLFSQTRDAIVKVRERELQSYGISERHSQLLFIIKLIGRDATPAGIARWLFREPHSISEILNRMEKQGLIRKVKDLKRKNQVRIEITEKGEDQYRRSFIPRNIPDTFSKLSEGEQRQFIAILMKLRETAIEDISARLEVPLPPMEGQ
ncbi:MAG: MarR family transcriptional regulator [Dehalococcoidales bacterium]|nr:MarR family transcriptional regulator [Dehalococcoidales bacterium]